MDDLERYGDYNEYEDDAPKGKSPVAIVLKLLVAIVCIAVVGVLVFRMSLFNYYPNSMKNIYFNDTLSEFYTATSGNIGAKTQELRAPYDDPDKGRFFCDNLIIIPGANQLQVSVRYNVSLADTLTADLNALKAENEKLGIEMNLDGVDLDLDKKSTEIFTFRLVRNPVDADSEPTVIGELTYSSFDTLLMYRYTKLVFDNVDFGLDEGEDKVNWIRLEIFINGVQMQTPYMVAVYENNDVYSQFDAYTLSADERP